MGFHHLLLSRTTSNFSFVLFQAVEDFVVLWFVLCHHPSKFVSSLVNANSAGHHRIVKDASSNHRLAVRLFVLVLGGHQLHQVGDLLPYHLRRLLDHLAVQAVELCEVVVCQFFSCFVDIWEVCKRNSELNAQVLEHFLKPSQQLLFLSILPKGRHLFLQIGDKDCMDLCRSSPLDKIIHLSHC